MHYFGQRTLQEFLLTMQDSHVIELSDGPEVVISGGDDAGGADGVGDSAGVRRASCQRSLPMSRRRARSRNGKGFRDGLTSADRRCDEERHHLAADQIKGS